MNIVVIADESSLIGELTCDSVDVLISCGDLYDGAIQRAVEHFNPRHVLAVRGNHDPDAPFKDGIVDLHLRTHTIDGITFGGFKGCWRYKPRGHHLYDQFEVDQMMRAFPPVDIFIAHNSPAGVHERDGDIHQGFDAFISYIDKAQPSLFLHGHQHTNSQTLRGNTAIIGVYGEQRFKIEL